MVFDLDALWEQYNSPISNSAASNSIAYDNDVIQIHDWDGRTRPMSEILNELRYRISVLEEKEQEREQGRE